MSEVVIPFIVALILAEIFVIIVGCSLLSKLKIFSEISSMYKSIYELDQKLYKSMIAEIKSIEDIYADHKSIMDLIASHYDRVTEQYKKIGEITDGYRTLCKECVDRYGDAYDQFKLCTEKLDRIFIAPACSCGGGDETWLPNPEGESSND